MNYLHWQEKTISDLSSENISSLYDDGFVFTRIGKSVMHQTRSVRVNLAKFEPSSENRRILKKTEGLELSARSLPLPEYDYAIGKLAKDFYENKFGPGIMSAQKVKEMLTDPTKSNFNSLFEYSINGSVIGYAICYANAELIHYSYPFYDLSFAPKDAGLGMMTRAILSAKETGMKYAHLGSLQRPSDVYKLQFRGLEWFDGKEWSSDLKAAREVIKGVDMDRNK